MHTSWLLDNLTVVALLLLVRINLSSAKSSGHIAGRHPLGACPSLQLFLSIHEIHILQTECAGLVQEEPDEQSRCQVGANKDKAKGVPDLVTSQGRQETNQNYPSQNMSLSISHGSLTVSQPIPRCRQRCLLCACSQRKRLANNDPRHRAPGGRKRADKHAD